MLDFFKLFISQGPESLTEEYTKLISLCLSNDNSDSKWLSALESTNLLRNVKKALKCATDVAGEISWKFLIIPELIDSGHSVVVMDKTGHDRTCQITSLAMLMLDSYYRTIEGNKK